MPTLIAVILTKAKRSHSVAMVVLASLSVFLGAIAFSLTQHVNLGIAIYWAITTATTVGYGDISPHNTVGRVIAVAVMVTAVPLFAAAFALLAAAAAASRLSKLLHVQDRPPKGEFIAIYGSHATVAKIAAEVAAAGERVLVVADRKLDALSAEISTIEGDPTLEATLLRSEPSRASRLLIAPEDDKDSLIIGVILRHLAPDVPTLAVVQSSRIASALLDLGVTATVSAEDLLGHTLAKSIETPHAAQLLLMLVSSKEFRFQETAVPSGKVGQPISKVRAEHDGLVLGIVKRGKVMVGVADDPILEAGDSLLLLSSETA